MTILPLLRTRRLRSGAAWLAIAAAAPLVAQPVEQPPSAPEPSLATPAAPVEPAAPATDPAADATDDPAAAAADEDVAEIVVVAGRPYPRGSVIGDIAPEIVLDARAIRGYGASNLTELLEEISPLTGSIQGRDGGGQPVVLLGGRRISSFREIADLPPEAVQRIDILPEEVALKYGYRPDQKVVNFVLRRRFNAITAEGETRLATDGGRQQHEADVTYLRIDEGSRLSLDAEYERANPLFENERDLIDPDPDRTLLSASDSVKLNGTYNRTILGNVSATVNAELSGEDTLAGLGRSTDGSQRLLRDGETRTANLNYALNGDLAKWRWALTGGYTRDQSTNLTDREAVAGSVTRDRARSINEILTTEATANGALFRLPAGDVTATFTAGANLRDIASRTVRTAATTFVELKRDESNGQVNLDVPVLRNSAVGDVSLNGNAAISELSDFGTLTTFGGGFNWEPIEELRLIGSILEEDGAPTIQQLGNPILVTPNVRVLDIVRGQTVDVTRVEGGNPDLLADSRRVLKLGLTVKPIRKTDLTLLANYTDSRIDNPTASLPTATPEIEAAFPDRFTRDASGTLIRIDSRPVNFAQRTTRQFRWGLNWSEVLEGPPPTGPDGKPLTPEQIEARREAFRDARAQGRPPGGPGGPGGGRGFGRGGPGGPGGFGGPGGRNGRIQASIFHTWSLEDRVLIRPGVPVLDLLDGSAIGSTGGQPRHQVEARLGYNRNGIGVRLDADWQSATRVLADPIGGTSSAQDLRFGSLTTVNLRLFADLGARQALVRDHPFFRGSRATIGLTNLFNQRIEVRDGNGVIPVGYQPDLLDPLGRAIRISFRKIFF